MIYKRRVKPDELIVLDQLKKRMKLSNSEEQHYFSLKKGYEGEVIFDSYTEKLQCECLILNDLLFEVNRTTFQIDSLILTQEKIYYYEVKNFEGDYFYEGNTLFQKPKVERLNPLHQLERGNALFHQLLRDLGFNPPINPSVVFINPGFTLYQAPLNQPIIFPTQVKRHLSNINGLPSKISERHRQLADRLVSLHIKDSHYKRIPTYKYQQLQKGITCLKCASFHMMIEKYSCICRRCKNTETVSEAILRSVKEFKILFPDEKITTNTIYDWCNEMVSKRRISRVLSIHFKIVGVRQWAYYE